MRQMRKYVIQMILPVISTGLLLAGCGASGAMPPAAPKSEVETLEVLAQPPSLAVSHSIEGASVGLTFLTRNFTFVQEGEKQANRSGQGYVKVTVDNQTTSVYSNRFDTTDLAPGPHKFAVELVQNNGRPYPNTKITFMITIKPSEPTAAS